FLFNVVITHAKLFKDVLDPTKVDAVVKFGENSLTVTNSHINVSHFDVTRQLTFSQSPKDLRQVLATKGVVVSLRYDKSSLGNAVVSLPDTFLDKIGPTMNDLFHEETLPLIRQKDSIGTVSFLLVLMVKCGEKEPERRSSRMSSRRSTTIRKSRTSMASVATTLQLTSPNKTEKEECFGLGPTFNPQDVLFVVGDPDPFLKIPTEPCSDLASEEGDERLSLDLQRYRSLNRRVKFPADDPCPREKPSLGQLKKLTENYSKIIDSVAEKVRQVGVTTIDSPFEKTTATARTPQEIGTQRWIPVPNESEEEYGVKPIRHCPVCLYPMSWLPRYIPCPRCNTRPRQMLKAEMKMTANEIMAEQLVRPKANDLCLTPCEEVSQKVKERCLGEEKPQPMVNSDSDAECPPCHCTCKDGKICAHCRIRRLCEEIFESADETTKQRELKEKQHLALYPHPRSSEDFSLIPGPDDDNRPYLYRVFSEMKSLYALHDTKKIKAIQRRCKSQTLLTMRSAYSLNEPQRVKSQAHVRESHSRQKAGHKHCLPPDSAVSRRHGWDWPRSHNARKHGWRPGAILRAAEKVMRFFLTSKDCNPCGQVLAEHEELQRQNSPVLSVCKREGEIFVTLHPLASLGMRQRPITFRIVKSHLAVALRQIKRALKDQGFEKCICHNSLMMCTCRDALQKFELNKALRKECRRRLIEPCPEHLVLTDTSVSDLEFNLDVHPPSRNFRSQIKAIRNAVNHGTQTSKSDALPPPQQYPMKVPPYYQGFDCAVGDRFMGTSFGLPGEDVFEDGVFGMEGGGPHGPSPMPCGRTKPTVLRGAGGRGRVEVLSASGTGPWKSFPSKAAKGKVGNSDPIPVRYPKRFLKPAQDAAKAAKQAELDAAQKKKKGPDMLKYLQAKGTLVRPWNPIEGKDMRPRPVK
ncbi:hypothetical protein KR054_011623, partial [Drosophila jambulina]